MKFSRLSQVRHEIVSLLSGYPDFVLKDSHGELKDHIPVFVFHTIDPLEFERQLIFLQTNGYQTVSIGEFYDFLANGKSTNGRSVLLTIDDCRSSCWRYAFPLLRKYQAKATLFAIPGLTEGQDSAFKNLDNVWAGECSESAVAEQDPRDVTLCNWRELAAMKETGLIDIENHSLFHKEVFVSSHVRGTITATDVGPSYDSPATPYLTLDDARRAIDYSSYVGLPVFETSSLFSGRPFYDPAPLRSRGPANWTEKEMYQLTEEECIATMRNETRVAMEILSERLGEDSGTHFCLPFSIGSDAAVDVLRSLGIRSCFWGVLPGKRENRAADDPFRVARIKGDFVERLPGEGRRSLLSIYGDKVKRRLAGKRVF